jgi:hypothetical protein
MTGDRMHEAWRVLPSLVMTLIGSACTHAAVGPKPHIEQRRAASTPPDAANSTTLATPEAAVKLYVESLAANDFASALRAYAAHESAARFDFTSFMRTVIHLAPSVQMAPAEYPMFVEINELRAQADMAAATKSFVYGLLTDRDPRGSQPVESDAEIQAFVQAVNPARLAKLRVVRIDPARQFTDGREAQAMFTSQAIAKGAQEMTERIALYELTGQFFWSGFRLCRYDGSWKVCEFGAFYGGPPSGGVSKTTTAEYEARAPGEPALDRGPPVEATTQNVRPPAAEIAVEDAAHACVPSSAKGFATPEAAINFYVESIAVNDLTCAMRAYAAHEHAARFDFRALVSWAKVLSPGVLKAPAQYPMFVEMNEHVAKAEMADATKLLVYGLLTDASLSGSQTLEPDAKIQDFVQAVNPARLARVKVVRIDPPRQAQFNGPKAQAHFKELATLEGADEVTERIALYELSGQLFWSGFRLCRYDASWKLYAFKSTFGGPFDVVEKTTAPKYQAGLQ